LNDSITTLSSIVSELVASIVEPELHKHQLGFGSFDLLAATHRSSGKMSQAEIARNLNVSPASLTDSVHLCMKRGLIEQHPDPTDGRKKLLMLTPKGKQVFQACLDRIRHVEARIESEISAEDREKTIAVLKKIAQILAVSAH
jgi:DNA-binding MarR family transcriptional regulator